MNPAKAITAPFASAQAPSWPHLDRKPGPVTAVIFIGLLAAGLLFGGYSLVSDVSDAGPRATTLLPYILLGVALLIALGFEFVNGFHDTANAVATVIYTHSLPPNFAVIWSGLFDFVGVLFSSGAVAFGIISLTYAQGASAELVAMVTIGAADMYGLPVSTTHVLSSDVAGTMAANRSGLQMSTIRNLLMAWVLTLPIAIVLSGSLYWIFVHLF